MSSIHVGVTGKKVQREESIATKSKLKKYLPRYLSIAPYYIIFLAFGITPTIYSLYLAFQKWDGIAPMQFVGFNNFSYALTDPIFGQAIIQTFEIWFMSTIPMLFLALLLAFLINQRRRSKFLYQVGYYVPYITSIVAITLVFGSLFGEQYGLINQMLTSMHLPAVQWLTDSWAMRWAVALMVIWRWTGYNALIYTAGLQSIPGEFYEAARVDGANTWNTFFRVTIPMMRPIILFTVITSTIGGLSLFVEPQILFGNNGGVGNAGLTMSLYQYWQTFPSDHYGYGAAVSWIIFLIILAFSIVNWQVIQRTNR